MNGDDLRARLAKGTPVLMPGVWDALSARLVVQAGFDTAFVSGFCVSGTRLGVPDFGYLTQTEMAETDARVTAAAPALMVLIDADTGYGNALSVRRTVQAYEGAGVAGLHIEDQVAPKRCGHLSGHQVIPRGEFAGKIRAAADARQDRDFLIIARTDAISAVDFDEALRRGEAALKAGADVLFIEAPRDEAQVERVAKAFDAPLLYNYAPGGRSPLLPLARLRELRYAIILLPVDTLLVGVRAIADFLAEVKKRDDVTSLNDRYMPFAEFNQLIGAMAMMEAADRYRDE